MASAVQNVETDGKKNIHIFPRLYAVVLQFDLQNFIVVQDGFVFVADIKVLLDHPCDLPSRGKSFFFLCSLFLNEDSSFEVSVDVPS